jgi:hypothetical protein
MFWNVLLGHMLHGVLIAPGNLQRKSEIRLQLIFFKCTVKYAKLAFDCYINCLAEFSVLEKKARKDPEGTTCKGKSPLMSPSQGKVHTKQPSKMVIVQNAQFLY